MAVDSTIARTHEQGAGDGRGGVGLLRDERSAAATAFPAASAGAMVPKPVVMPATMIDVTATSVKLSIVRPFWLVRRACHVRGAGSASARASAWRPRYTAARILKM